MKIRRKLWIWGISVALMIILAAVYVFLVGGHYTLHTGMFLGEKSQLKTEVTFSDESVVRLADSRIENEEWLLDVEALSPGKTTVNIQWTYGGDTQSWKYDLSVNMFGTLIERSPNMSFNGFGIVVYAILGILSVTQLMMLWLFVDYRKQGDFSYPMVACGGVGIYNLVVLAYLLYKFMNNVLGTVGQLIKLIVKTGELLLIGLTPIMLVLSVLLAVSNIWLMHHEGRRPVNTLGIIFSVVWFIGMAIMLGSPTWIASLNISSIYSYYRIIWTMFIYIAAYFECMFLSTIVCTYLAVRYSPAADRDYIIILGCAIRKDGGLTPLLKGRVDSAVAFEKKQYAQTGKHAVFVPSGGQGADEVISEGEAMENYLLSIGIPQEQIAREDKSTDTFQNMKFSKEVIEKHSGTAIQNKKIAFATTNYHIFRGYILAKKNGFEAKGISAKTKPYFYPNAFLREFIGLLVDRKWNHIGFICSIILLFLSHFFFIG